LVRITLKRAYADGTVAVELDPLSLLCRLATRVPPPRFHTVKYAGVLAPASPWRSRIAPQPKPPLQAAEPHDADLLPKHASSYRAWAELLKRTFDIDVLACPKCHGRMKLLAMITDAKTVERYLAKLGEPTQVPGRSPSRSPYWKSKVLRLKSMAGQR
jgi:Putative transposase